MPRGPVTAYALLGASFQPDESSTVLQITACEDEGGVPLTESMAALPETPLVGLPGEFVQPVLEGAVLAGAEPGLRSSGELIFDRAAFGPIGSNGLLFRQLAASLTRMLLGEIDQWEDLLRHELNRD